MSDAVQERTQAASCHARGSGRAVVDVFACGVEGQRQQEEQMKEKSGHTVAKWRLKRAAAGVEGEGRCRTARVQSMPKCCYCCNGGCVLVKQVCGLNQIMVCNNYFLPLTDAAQAGTNCDSWRQRHIDNSANQQSVLKPHAQQPR